MASKQTPLGRGRLLYGGIIDAHSGHPFSVGSRPLLERIQLFGGTQGVEGPSATNLAMRGKIPLFTHLPRGGVLRTSGLRLRSSDAGSCIATRSTSYGRMGGKSG